MTDLKKKIMKNNCFYYLIMGEALTFFTYSLNCFVGYLLGKTVKAIFTDKFLIVPILQCHSKTTFDFSHTLPNHDIMPTFFTCFSSILHKSDSNNEIFNN